MVKAGGRSCLSTVSRLASIPMSAIKRSLLTELRDRHQGGEGNVRQIRVARNSRSANVRMPAFSMQLAIAWSRARERHGGGQGGEWLVGEAVTSIFLSDPERFMPDIRGCTSALVLVRRFDWQNKSLRT